jgi:hypothetical protein
VDDQQEGSEKNKIFVFQGKREQCLKKSIHLGGQLEVEVKGKLTTR